MKRIAFLMVFCIGWLVGCDKDNGVKENPDDKSQIPLMNGSIVVERHPDIKITALNEFPLSGSTEADISQSRKRTGMKRSAVDDLGNELRGNDYRFKLVAQMSTMKIDEVDVQATDVKISDDGNFAFVSYNDKGDAHRGGVVVYKYTIHEGTLETVRVDVEAISSLHLRNAELSAIDYYNGKIYVTGASSEPEFGYDEDIDGFNYAFFMVIELNADKTFNTDVDPTVVKLTSFQGTSIRALNERIYITTGDGTNDTQGGLYIFRTADCSLIKFISDKDNARSVDVDESNIYLMQANHARVTKYDLDGNSPNVIHDVEGEAMQRYAKSEILAWNDYLFVAENESGLRMLFKDGGVNASLDRPGDDEELHVTNSVCMNSDSKRIERGGNQVEWIQSDLLFLANGEKGIYWYDIVRGADDKDYIVSSNNNSILGGTSSNFIASKHNIVFVADGLGGLKVLYIGFNSGPVEPPIATACVDFMNYLYRGVSALLPEGRSVFRTNPAPDPIIQTLFSNAGDVIKYIEVLENNTELYISFLFENAAWNNALGFFVIPGSENTKTDAEEYAYYQRAIRPNLCTTVGNRNVLKEEYIIFRNIRRGILGTDNTWRIGGNSRTFNAGDKVVLFMAPNSWIAQNNRVEINFSAGAYDQIFFMHQHFNVATRVTYSNTYRTDFRGIQHNAFTAEECNSIVIFFEDNHNSSDTDYNDVIVSISDNIIEGKLNSKIKLPKYTIKVGANGRPEFAN